jgi:AcrR family transcriptional regulator
VPAPTDSPDTRRRVGVLESALETFARTGFRGTSMDAIARAAKISRPGLYFLFESKEALFREAVSHAIAQDLAAVARIFSDSDRPLADRILDGFDTWAGRYVGPIARDVPTVIADNPELLDDVARQAPARFDALLHGALADEVDDPELTAQTLTSVSVGLINQVSTRAEYVERLRGAIRLFGLGEA